MRFLVIRDREVKTKLWEIFDGLGAAMAGGPPEATPWPDVPALIAVLGDPPPNAPAGSPVPASVYPAVQNILLTVHAMGLGSVLTTRWKTREDEVRAILGYPEAVQCWAILPIGWPTRKYGRGKRRPVPKLPIATNGARRGCSRSAYGHRAYGIEFMRLKASRSFIYALCPLASMPVIKKGPLL